MLLACNGFEFEFESTRSISAGFFFFPRVLTGDRLHVRRIQWPKPAPNPTHSSQRVLDLAPGIHSSIAGL
jgi:hypothetical protein